MYVLSWKSALKFKSNFFICTFLSFLFYRKILTRRDGFVHFLNNMYQQKVKSCTNYMGNISGTLVFTEVQKRCLYQFNTIHVLRSSIIHFVARNVNFASNLVLTNHSGIFSILIAEKGCTQKMFFNLRNSIRTYIPILNSFHWQDQLIMPKKFF